MGIRSKLKAAVVRRLGGDASTPTGTSPASPAPAPQPAATPPDPPVAAASEPAVESPPPAPNAPTPTTPPVDDEMAAKAAKHFEKTRRAVLSFVVEQGGVASMADMHAYSERRYFIAHRRFSDLMEEIVGEGLVDYDEGAGEATITAAGQAYLAD